MKIHSFFALPVRKRTYLNPECKLYQKSRSHSAFLKGGFTNSMNVSPRLLGNFDGVFFEPGKAHIIDSPVIYAVFSIDLQPLKRYI